MRGYKTLVQRMRTHIFKIWHKKINVRDGRAWDAPLHERTRNLATHSKQKWRKNTSSARDLGQPLMRIAECYLLHSYPGNSWG